MMYTERNERRFIRSFLSNLKFQSVFRTSQMKLLQKYYREMFHRAAIEINFGKRNEDKQQLVGLQENSKLEKSQSQTEKIPDIILTQI